MELYPDNKISSYKVHLSKPLFLPGSYEVALEEIIYPTVAAHFERGETWIEVFTGKLNKDDFDQKERIPVEAGSAEYLMTVVWSINSILEKYDSVDLQRKGLLQGDPQKC